MNAKDSLFYTLDKMGATYAEVCSLITLFQENKINGAVALDHGDGCCLIGSVLKMRDMSYLRYFEIWGINTEIIENYIFAFTPNSDDDFLLEERLNVVDWLSIYRRLVSVRMNYYNLGEQK